MEQVVSQGCVPDGAGWNKQAEEASLLFSDFEHILLVKAIATIGDLVPSHTPSHTPSHAPSHTSISGRMAALPHANPRHHTNRILTISTEPHSRGASQHSRQWFRMSSANGDILTMLHRFPHTPLRTRVWQRRVRHTRIVSIRMGGMRARLTGGGEAGDRGGGGGDALLVE